MAERTAMPPTGPPVGPSGGGTSGPARRLAGTVDDPPGSPPARRLRRPGWLNLRLVLGVLLVLGSVLLGARTLAAADSSVRVWAVTGDLAAGTTLTSADVSVARVRLFSDADRYLRTTTSPAGHTLNRDVGAGELLPRSALTTQPEGRLISLPVPVLHAPEGLRRGQRVDVFATSKPVGGTGPARTERVLAGVPIQAVRAPRGGLAGGSTEYAVIVRVTPADVEAVIRAIRTAEIDVAVVTGGEAAGSVPR